MSGLPDIAFAKPEWFWLLLALPIVALAGFIFGRRRGIPRRVTWLRVAAMLLMLVALSEPLWSTGKASPVTVFVVDRSASVAGASDTSVIDWVNQSLESADSNQRAAIVSFGSIPELTEPAASVSGMQMTDSADTRVNADSTNIETALAMARALPLGGSRRIVLVSDGAENSGIALNQAAQAATERTPIDVLPVEGIGSRDLRIEGISAPSKIWQGESTTIVVSVATSDEGAGTLDVSVDGEPSTSQNVEFRSGLNTFTVTIDDLPAGFHALDVTLSPGTTQDRYTENNNQAFGLVVRESPQLLLITPASADSSYLRSQLEGHGARLTEYPPADLPERLSELSQFDAIILNNVPASDLSLGQVAALREMTRGSGRGLIVIGGTNSFGPGAYANTPLEELLPVKVKVTEGKDRQRVALMLILDRSGSMAYDPLQTTSKIEMAKEAVRLAADSLLEGDEIGILAFNDKQQWVVRLTKISGQDDRDRIHAQIDQLTADGGTEIYSALDVGFDEIFKSDADVRHIVLLSDGKSSTGTRESYAKLIDDVRTANTTLSTIAIGDDADTDLLQFLAEEGNGRYKQTERAEDIPKLTLAEAKDAASQSVVRGDFAPIQVVPSSILTGFNPEELPVISGYDYSEAKPDAQVVLTSSRSDPVLTQWQFGLGRVVAWTADDGIDFANQWRNWDGYGDFWMNLVRWSLPDPESGPVRVSAERDGSNAVITVASTGDTNDYVDLSNASATIVSPSAGITTDLPLYQSAPGEYQLRFTDPEPGAYQFKLQKDGADLPGSSLSSFSIPASPELKPSPDAGGLLQDIAARTGGAILSLDDPGAVFDAPAAGGSSLQTYSPIWWLPLSLGLILLLAELAIRYQAVGRLLRPLRLLRR